MKWRSLRNRAGADDDIKMTPMIDVVFLLLIYFLCTASFQLAEFDHLATKIQTQGAELVDLETPPPPEADFQDLVIRLQIQGQQVGWTLNGQTYPSLESLAQKLKQIAQSGGESATVILHPDGDVPLGNVMDVFDEARGAPFDTVSFAATDVEEP